MRVIALYPLLILLSLLWSCGSDQNPLIPNPNNPNLPGEPLTDEARLAVLDKCNAKAEELNNLKTFTDKIQFIAWAFQQPEFRTAGFLDGSGIYTMFRDERMVFFVDTPLTNEPPEGGRVAQYQEAAGRQEQESIGRESQTGRTTGLPKTNQVTLYNGMGSYFEDNTQAIENIFRKSPSRYSVRRLDATIENLKLTAGDGVFYIFTHGGGGAIPNPPPRTDSLYVMSLWTKNPVTPQSEINYKTMLDEKKLAYMRATFNSTAGEMHYAITSEFAKTFMTFGENSIIYIDACNSYRTTPASQAFRTTILDKASNKKATYFGWTFETNLFNASQASQFIFDRLLGTNTTGSGPVPIPKEDPIQRPFDLKKVYKDLQDRHYDVCANSATLKYETRIDEAEEILLVPTIERLEIYESMSDTKSTLQIYGSFGNEKGKVTVNGEEMEDVEWTDNNIICSIRDSGVGSAGDVIVSVRDLQSNPVPVTLWNIKLNYSTNNNGIILQGVIDLKLRADIHPTRTKPKEEPSLYEYPDLSPTSGYIFGKTSEATYHISGQKYAKCEWVPCPNTFEETPHVRDGTVPYEKLMSPSNKPRLLALYNWSPDRKVINLTHLSVILPDITTTTYYQLADCPGEDQELRSTELTSMNFSVPDYELNDVLQLVIADNYNIRAGSYSKDISRPWNPCDNSGDFKIRVSWELSHPQFEPLSTTPARGGELMEKSLDAMRYQTFLPRPELEPFVRNYTVIHFQFGSNAPIPTKQRSPKVEQKIVFYVKGSVRLSCVDANKSHTPPPVALYSHQLNRMNLQVTPEFFTLVIYLKPGALYSLVRLPMSEFHPECFDAELFFGNEVRQVREQLADARDSSAMIAIAEKFLLNRLREVRSRNSVDVIAAQVLNDPTSFSIDRMAHEACLSTRQFHRKFVERIGISPKFFSRLSRYNHAYQYKLTHPNVTWSSIAQEFSYTDYHHMEKEFKSFLGLTPMAWIEVEQAAPERILKLR